MKKLFYIMAMAAIGITACSKSQAPDPDNSQAEEPVAETATTYHISIPATMGDGADTKAVSFGTNTITSGFVTTDNVCAYNKTRGYSLGGHLSPDANASNCTLTGDLSGTIKVGDNLLLVINNFTLRYDNQSGTPSSASLHDFSECVMKVKSVSPSLVLCQVDDENNTTAVFHKTGSMFRQSFSFQDYDGTPIATPERIQRIDLATANLSLVSRYFPREEGSDKYTMSHLENSVYLFSGSGNVLDSNGNAYFALMFNYDAPPTPTSHDALLVFATDNNNNSYYVTKSAPSTGFQAGKYYYGNITLTKTHKPTIVETSSGNQATPTEETNNYIQFPSVSITMSGASAGYCYYFTGNSTITLTDGFSAEFVGLLPFIETSGNNIDLVLDGNASISSPYSFYAPILTYSLKLSGNGSLTITSKYPENCGIYGLNYYYCDNTDYTNAYNTTSEIDVSAQLAQPGYTVIRSARTDNPDGTYTWTYTVTPTGAIPSKFSISATDKVYFSQGNLQWSGNNGWRFAPHQYDYIGDNANNNTPTASNDNYMDLFCWGATGLNGVAPNTNSAYLTGTVTLGGNNNWGACNITNGGGSGIWRTPRLSEWSYLLGDRSTPSGIRYAKATVNSVPGVILLPDDWSTSDYALASTNTPEASFSANIISLTNWENKLEAHGAVFLPAAGFRFSSYIDSATDMYWSFNPAAGADEAACILFGEGFLYSDSQSLRSNGLSVRLVRDVN